MERGLLLRFSESSIFSWGALTAYKGEVDVTELGIDVEISVEECFLCPDLFIALVCNSPINSLESLLGDFESNTKLC